MSNLKLGVQVVGAYNLLPKDSHGSSSAFVEVHFDGQKFRTTVKEKDLNPVWDETFYFNVSNPNNLPSLQLEAYVYNNAKDLHSKSFLGKVRINGTAFVPESDAVVLHYPLEKRSIFSHVQGELGLKVFVTDDPSIKSSVPSPELEETKSNSEQAKAKVQAQAQAQGQAQATPPRHIPNFLRNLFFSNKTEPRNTFHHLPNSPEKQQNHSSEAVVQPQMRFRPQAPQMAHMFAGPVPQPIDYALKETSPFLGGGRVVRGRVIPMERPASTYDLVEQMHILFVRIVKARNLPSKDLTGGIDPYVEVRIGNYKGKTKHFEKNEDPEWNVVFAFPKERLQSSFLEVVVKDKDMLKDEFIGLIRLDMNEIPTRVPPDSPLAPQWHWLEDRKGQKNKGELMLAVWFGTQADEAYPDAWYSDAVPHLDSSLASSHIRSKVYHSPRLWYLRVNVIEAQDLVSEEKNRFPDVYVKAWIGNQVLKTKPVQSQTMNAIWNEDLIFVTAEPFEDHLILTVEDRAGRNKDEILGKTNIPLKSVQRRADDRMVYSMWYHLHKSSSEEVEHVKDKGKFASRLHLRVYLDGGTMCLMSQCNIVVISALQQDSSGNHLLGYWILGY
ncbi:hypothetical protein NMG60_11029071 [Bertholletia excelsa]